MPQVPDMTAAGLRHIANVVTTVGRRYFQQQPPQHSLPELSLAVQTLETWADVLQHGVARDPWGAGQSTPAYAAELLLKTIQLSMLCKGGASGVHGSLVSAVDFIFPHQTAQALRQSLAQASGDFAPDRVRLPP
eukprot:4489045-Lingulodinium_polyedra.AAC.1